MSNNSESGTHPTEGDVPDERRNDPKQGEKNDPLATATQRKTNALGNGSSDSPQFIGPYKILQQIAEGGMGVVYMAEQATPIRRRVALKVIKSGVDSQQVVSRFEAERQALALMNHPNIARVFDGGQTEDGSPYFAMELVNGIPFLEYCDKNKLTVAERLSLFIPVCKAIQHAHQKGIIHRDLKPSNVLVASSDGPPVPKVIDFGLAKAIEHQSRLTDKTMFTEFGQVMGTLQYMSPEQAEMNQMDVDTRTDIYSLGVMLYELLSGSTPLDRKTLGEKALLEVLALIREKDPPRPSTRLSESSELASGISAQRQIQPSRLQQILRGDLDWIVMKSLEKDRTRRYDTANDFAEDLRRFLENEAILARPPSVSYKLSKTFKRHRVGFITAGMFLATVGVLLGIVTFLYFEANYLAITNEGLITDRDKRIKQLALLNEQQVQLIDERTKFAASESLAKEEAKREAADQRATTSFLFEVFGARDPLFNSVISRYGSDRTGTISVKELALEATRAEIEDERTAFPSRPHLRARILGGLADLSLSCGDMENFRDAVAKALAILPDTQENLIDRSKLLVSAAQVDFCYGDMRAAEQKLLKALPVLEQAHRADPNDRELKRKYQDIPLVLGLARLALDRTDEAIVQFEIMGSLEGQDSATKLRRLGGRLFAEGVRLDVNQRLSKPHQSYSFVQDALTNEFDVSSDLFSSRAGKLVMDFVGFLFISQANEQLPPLEQLEKWVNDVESYLGRKHLLNAFPLFYAFNRLKNRGQYRESLEYNSKLLALIDEQLGVRKHPRLREILSKRGDLLLRIWQDEDTDLQNPELLEEAIAAHNEAIQIGEQAFGKEHWQVGYAHYYRAKVFRALGLYDRAMEDLEVGLALLTSEFGENHKYPGYCLRELADVFLDQDKLRDAERALRQRVKFLDHETVPTSRTAGAQLGLADFLWVHKKESLRRADMEEILELTNSSLQNYGTSLFGKSNSQARAEKIREEVMSALSHD